MAFNAKVGTFAGRSSPGTVTVTGVGFTPKIVFILAAESTTWDTFTTPIYHVVGVAVGSGIGQQRTQSVGAEWDGVAFFDHNTRRERRGGEVISEITPAFGFAQQFAALSSFNSDGFVISFSLVAGIRNYSYLALGGSDLSVAIGTTNWPTSTGNQAVTGVGFQPSVVWFTAGTDFISGESSTHPGGAISHGWIDQDGRQGCSGWHNRANVTTADNHRYQRTDKCIAVHDSTAGTIVGEAEAVSMDSDGFTINWTTAPAAVAGYSWVALGGIVGHVGSLTQPTSTGTQDVTGLDTTPIVTLLQSAGAVASSSLQDSVRYSLGWGDASASGSLWSGDNDATTLGTNRANRRLSNTSAVIAAAPTGISAGTLEAAAAVDSFAANQFTLNWTTADATGREVLYLALGPTPTYTLACDPGAYTISGTEASLEVSGHIHADPGSYVISGTDTTLTYDEITTFDGPAIEAFAAREIGIAIEASLRAPANLRDHA